MSLRQSATSWSPTRSGLFLAISSASSFARSGKSVVWTVSRMPWARSRAPPLFASSAGLGPSRGRGCGSSPSPGHPAVRPERRPARPADHAEHAGEQQPEALRGRGRVRDSSRTPLGSRAHPAARGGTTQVSTGGCQFHPGLSVDALRETTQRPRPLHATCASRDKAGAGRTVNSEVAAGTPRGRGGSGSCAARRRPRDR